MDPALLKTLFLWLSIGAGVVVIAAGALSNYYSGRVDERSQEEFERRLAAQISASQDGIRELETAAKEERKDLKRKFEEVEGKLQPFISLAHQRYPDLKAEAALAKLRSDITAIRELATRDVPKSPAKEVLAKTLSSLKAWQQAHPTIPVVLSIGNAGTPHAEQVFRNVVDSCRRANINSKIGMWIGVSSGRIAPMTIKTNGELKTAAERLVVALAPYIQGQSKYVTDEEHQQIEILFNGTPKFSTDGRISLE